MSKNIKLKCTANAYVDGDLVKVGKVIDYPESEAGKLIASNRFKVATEDDQAKKPSTVKELKAALDELDVQYASDAKQADLKALYEEATAE